MGWGAGWGGQVADTGSSMSGTDGHRLAGDPGKQAGPQGG